MTIRKITKRKTTKRTSVKRARNPDTFHISDKDGNQIYQKDIERWMTDYMEHNPNYDPRAMSYKAGKYFEINVHSTKSLDDLAFEIAEKFEYNKERSRQRKSPTKTKGFPLGLGNSPFKKQNPDGQLKPRGITLPEVKKWMIGYIKTYPDYEPREMAKHAIAHLNIQVTPADRKIITDFAYKVADEYEMSR
jgi:hypothetical protein